MHPVVEDVEGSPAVGGLQRRHPLVVGARLVVEALPREVHGDGVLHEGRGHHHQRRDHGHVDEVAADGLAHEVPVALVAVHPQVRGAGHVAGLVASAEGVVGLVTARCQDDTAGGLQHLAGGRRAVRLYRHAGHRAGPRGQPPRSHAATHVHAGLGQRGGEQGTEHGDVGDVHHAVDGVLAGARHEPAEAEAQVDQEAVGVGGPLGVEAGQSGVEEHAVALLLQCRLGDHVGEVGLRRVGDAGGALGLEVGEGHVAGGARRVAADGLQGLQQDHRGACSRRLERRRAAAGAAAHDDHVGSVVRCRHLGRFGPVRARGGLTWTFRRRRSPAV